MLRKTIYAHTIRELEEQAAEVRRQVSTGTVVTNENMTVSEWASEWFNTYKSGVSYNTQEMYKLVINTHIIPFMGHIKLKDVRPHHIQRLINDKRAEGLTRTVEQITLTLNQIFKRAIDNNLMIKNPVEKVELPKRERPKKRVLTEEEIKSIEAADLSLKARAYLYVMMYAGLRRGEALALTKKDIDLKKRTISIYKALIFKKNTPEIKPTPKSEAGNRIIPMPDVLVDVLSDYLKEVDSLYVFTSEKNEIMSKAAFRRFWEKIEKQINIAMGGNGHISLLSEDVASHMFRHTYSTSLYYSGVDLKTAQYLMGHENVTVMLEIYTHLDKSKIMDAADKLNAHLSGSHKVVNESISYR